VCGSLGHCFRTFLFPLSLPCLWGKRFTRRPSESSSRGTSLPTYMSCIPYDSGPVQLPDRKRQSPHAGGIMTGRTDQTPTNLSCLPKSEHRAIIGCGVPENLCKNTFGHFPTKEMPREVSTILNRTSLRGRKFSTRNLAAQ